MRFFVSISTASLLLCVCACTPGAQSEAQDLPPASSIVDRMPANANSDEPDRDLPVPPINNSQLTEIKDRMISEPSYNFDAPDHTFELPKSLKEISGLSLLDNDHLGAVQDEKGRIFKISIDKGKLVDEIKFGKDGDYEGIERVGDDLYVLRSDGDIYRIKDFDPDDPDKNPDVKKYETFLDQKHDTEGLGFDPQHNRLLVVCKEAPGAGLKNSRTVYAFDLSEHEMIKEPVLVIDLKQIENLTPEHPLNRAIRNLASPLRDMSGFKPAALAVHPITGQIFIVSSVRKMLLAYNKSGTLENLWVLSEDRFRQPEGLAFLPNGDLFIANEGGNGRGTLMRFNFK